MAELIWRTREVHAQTHRGEYHLSVIVDGSEYDGQAYATFHGHDGSCENVDADSPIGPMADVQAACAAHARAQPAHPPMLGWPALLALCLLLLSGCSLAHGRIEGPPLYVHLCDAMPLADQGEWGEAAGAINAELEGPALWVGHGPPVGCDTVDVCPSSAVVAAETRVGTCVVTVRYAPGTAREATQELELLLRGLP